MSICVFILRRLTAAPGLADRRRYVATRFPNSTSFTYDGNFIRAWLDGRLETRVGFNPFAYPHGIHDGGPDGADFTVGAVHRSGEMGNWFTGRLGGLAVYSRGLEAEEIAKLSDLLPVKPEPSPTKPPVLV